MCARLLIHFLTALAVVSAGLVAAAPSQAQAATLTRVTSFGPNPGALAMYAHRPAGLGAGAPVVVALHGCTQDAAGYAAGSGWTHLADRWGFTVVLPQQSTANNSSKCFNWFQPGDVARGQGEAASVRSMVAHAVGTWGADPDRVFVSGLSAGGAMTAALLAAYPDVFSAGSIIAGIPVGCARDTASAFACMSSPPSRTPSQWAASVRAAAPSGTTDWPEVSIWHGTSDTTVRPANATASRDQWTAVHGLGQTPTATSSLPASTTRQDYSGSDGIRRVTTFLVQGMGHAAPNDPGTGPTQCGGAAAYFADTLCSSYYDGVLWDLDGDGGGDPDTLPAPTGVTVATESDTSLRLAWQQVDGAASYRVERDGALVATPSGTAFTDTGLAPGSTHTYRVAAVDTTGVVGAWSASASGRTSGGSLGCWTSSNYAHTQAGRAYHSGGYAYATGSDQNLGLWNTYVTTSLEQTRPGYYTKRAACPDP